MLRLAEFYEVRRVEVGDKTYYNHVIPFELRSGEKFLLDFSSVAKDAIRRDGRDHRGSVGPGLAIEVEKAVQYAIYVENHAGFRNAYRFSNRSGYIVKEDPKFK